MEEKLAMNVELMQFWKNLEEKSTTDIELIQFRKHCNEIYNERKNNVKFVLEKWLENFITINHRPWRAIEGKKKLRPIPINRNFFTPDKKRNKENLIINSLSRFYWPDLPDEEIMNIIKDLGFNLYCRGETLTLENMSLAVPAPRKGKPLTFAQKWVKKINDSYSEYMADEKHKAKTYYNSILKDLSNYDTDNIRINKGYMVFEKFSYESDKSMSAKCNSEMHKLLAKSGIILHYNPSSTSLECYVPLSLLNNQKAIS